MEPTWRTISGSGNLVSSHRVPTATSINRTGTGSTWRAKNVESVKSVLHIRNQRPQEPVEDDSAEVKQRNPEQHDKPLEYANAADFRAGQEPRHRSPSRPYVTSPYSVGTALSVAAENNQIGFLSGSGDALDNDVDRAIGCWNGPTISSSGLSGFDRDPSGESLTCVSRAGSRASSTHEQLMCQRRRGLAEPRREYCAADLVVAFACGVEKAEHAPSRSLAAECIGRRSLGRRCRRWDGSRCLGPRAGCAQKCQDQSGPDSAHDRL